MPAMSIVAEASDVVIGVDTHTDTHTAAAVNAVGVVLGQVTVTADAAGTAALLAFAAQHTATAVWAVEGTGSHGRGLTRALHAAGQQVVQAPVPPAARRRGAKTDTLDAVHAARAVLAVDRRAIPRADGDREALRVLLACRRHHSDQRTATVNLLKSLILTADDTLRERLRGLNTRQQVTLLRHDTTNDAGTETGIRHQQMITLAQQIHTLDTLLNANHRQLRDLVNRTCPVLLTQPGVGPVTAATALTAWSHRGRLHSEAAFAALAGTNPIPANSGRTTRYRLNRGGDRTLNAALHTIAITRRRHDPTTRDYVQRRRAEGKTDREITRCLKRYIARQLYRIMQTHTTP